MSMSELFEQFVIERGIRENTIEVYKLAIKHYLQFNDMTLEELLEEADMEENKGKRWKYRKLRSRLIGYRSYLFQDKGLAKSSVDKYFSSIKSIYSHFDIEIGKIPRYTSKSVKDMVPLTAEDIPTPEDVKLGMELAPNNVMKALIHFMSATGLAKVDTLSLTIRTFLEACDVDVSGDLSESLKYLSSVDDLVPTFYLKRVKTGKFFYTFCTSEAVNSVAKYLQTRNNYTIDDKLFKIQGNYVNTLFREINKMMGNKRKNNYSLFRSHMLRKFHSKQLHSNNGMREEDIDALQGRSKDKIAMAYHLPDKDELKKLYMMYMDRLYLFSDVEVKTVLSDEYKELQLQNKKNGEVLDYYKKRFDEQEKVIKEINECVEEFKKIVDL